MPYAPGIQDISGQLIAQGMSQAGAARARAIESLGESISGGIKQYQQNQLFTNQALGKFGQGLTDPDFQKYVNQVVNDDPNAPKVPDALKKAFKNAATGKVDIYDAALLGTAAEGYAQNRYIAAQTRNLAAETSAREVERDMRKAALERLNLFRSSYGGDTTGMVGPQPAERPTLPAAPQVSPEVLKFAATAPVGEPTTAIPKAAVPEAIGTFIQTAKPFAMPKAEAPAPAPSEPAVPGRMQVPSLQGGITLEQRKGLVRSGMPMEMVAAIPEQIPMQTVALAYEEYLGQLAQGKPANANTFLKSLREQEQLRRQGLGESREMTLDEAQKAVTDFNKAQQGQPPELRQQAFVRPTNRAGYYSLETQKGALTREEESARAQQQSEREMRQKMIPAAYDDVRKQAEDDRLVTPQIRKLQELYRGKKIEGKAFETLKSSFISIVKGLNFDVGEDLENAQGVTDLGRSLMNNLIVPYFNSLKGSTSNRDVDLIKSFGPQMTTNPQAAMAMLEIMDRRVEYNKAVQRQYTLFNAGRLTSADLSDKLIELQDRFEASIPEQSAFASQFNLTPPEQPAAKTGSTTGPTSGKGLRASDLKPGINYRTGSDGLYYEFGKP